MIQPCRFSVGHLANLPGGHLAPTRRPPSSGEFRPARAYRQISTTSAHANLRNLAVARPNHRLGGRHLPIGRGILYLVAIIDGASRAVLAWRLSTTMDIAFRLAALEEALARFGKPNAAGGVERRDRRRARGRGSGYDAALGTTLPRCPHTTAAATASSRGLTVSGGRRAALPIKTPVPVLPLPGPTLTCLCYFGCASSSITDDRVTRCTGDAVRSKARRERANSDWRRAACAQARLARHCALWLKSLEGARTVGAGRGSAW